MLDEEEPLRQGSHNREEVFKAVHNKTALHAPEDLLGDGTVCVLAIGKLLAAAEKAADVLAATGMDVTVWDVRCCAPLDPAMIADAARHRVVVTVEDGSRDGGIGMSIADFVHRINTAVPIEVLGVPTKFVPQAAKAERHARWAFKREPAEAYTTWVVPASLLFALQRCKWHIYSKVLLSRQPGPGVRQAPLELELNIVHFHGSPNPSTSTPRANCSWISAMRDQASSVGSA